MNPGTLIVFEGLDGAGKSTQLVRLARALRRAGVDVVTTREPTEGPHGRRIREGSTRGDPLAPEEERAIFVADREEHVRDLIAPALARGAVVLCDRYTLSTAAYQGARGLDPEALLCEGEARFPIPDLVLLLMIEPEGGLGRVEARGGERNRAFERPGFLARAARVFEQIDRPYIARIDASGDPAAVEGRIRSVLWERLGLELPGEPG